MSLRHLAPLTLAALSSFALPGFATDEPAEPARKVLVELYTSQGCNSCPSANDLLGRLASLGYGPDRIVPVAFHVDYFNTPWADPFSSNEFSRREMSYNSVLKRNDLYFTPMMMVDGRYPMLGSNKPEATASIAKSLKVKPGASLKLIVGGSGLDKKVQVDVKRNSVEVDGRPLQVCLAVTEGPIATKVPSGENAGSTLVEPAVVRSFAFRNLKLSNREIKSFTFPVKLATEARPDRVQVAVWVQDYENGKVYQAEAAPLDRGQDRRLDRPVTGTS